MDGGSITGRLETADNAITFHKGRASGLFYAPRLIPRAVRHSGNSAYLFKKLAEASLPVINAS